MIEKLKLQNFTVFDQLELEFAPHINIFIGENGTGKTHLLKLMYSFQSAKRQKETYDTAFFTKMGNVFKPRDNNIYYLNRRVAGHGLNQSQITVSMDGYIYQRSIVEDAADNSEAKEYLVKYDKPVVYIPVKEMLVNAPGFRSLYSQMETSFEEVYYDIIDKAYLFSKKLLKAEYLELAKKLSHAIKGDVKFKGETFYHVGKAGDVEFSLVAEGVRKLSLLLLLINNGSLYPGATLYWDEPETNLNPSMLPIVVETLLKLAELGVQIFIATHSYPLLKEFDLQKEKRKVRFFNLHFNENDLVRANTADKYVNLHPTKIAEEYTRLYELGVKRALGKSDE